MSANARNVTLFLPQAVVIKAKHLAIDRGTSLSGLVTQVLSEEVRRSSEYNHAKQQALFLLKTPFDLGSGGKGKRLPMREELHARRDG